MYDIQRFSLLQMSKMFEQMWNETFDIITFSTLDYILYKSMLVVSLSTLPYPTLYLIWSTDTENNFLITYWSEKKVQSNGHRSQNMDYQMF